MSLPTTPVSPSVCPAIPLASQVVIIHERGASRLPLSTPRTLHEIDALVRGAILRRGGDCAGMVVSLPHGSSTAIVNL